MPNVKNAVIFSFLAKYSGLLIQVIGTMVLARILTPEDFGVFAIAFVFLALANVLRELGVSQYLIKEKVLTDDKIRSAFTILLISSLIISSFLYFISDVVAKFYGEPRLDLLIQLLSLNVLLSPFGSIITALLNRELNFHPAFIASTISLLTSYITMIYLAYEGYGATTLVIGALIGTIGEILILQLYRPKELRMFPSFSKVGEVFHYSKFVMGSALIGQVGHYFSELAVGKFYSLETVGLLSRANGTADLFNRLFTSSLYPVLTPYIAKVNHKGEDGQRYFVMVTDVQLSLSLPFFVGMALLAEPLILIIFGSQWTSAATFLSIICLLRVIYSMTQHFTPLFLGMGLAKEVMKLDVYSNVIRILLICMFVQQGVVIMLTSLLVGAIFRLSYCLYLAKKHLRLDMNEYWSSVRRCALVTIITVLPLVVFSFSSDFSLAIIDLSILATVIAISMALWFSMIWNKTTGSLIRKLLFKR